MKNIQKENGLSSTCQWYFLHPHSPASVDLKTSVKLVENVVGLPGVHIVPKQNSPCIDQFFQESLLPKIAEGKTCKTVILIQDRSEIVALAVEVLQFFKKHQSTQQLHNYLFKLGRTWIDIADADVTELIAYSNSLMLKVVDSAQRTESFQEVGFFELEGNEKLAFAKSSSKVQFFLALLPNGSQEELERYLCAVGKLTFPVDCPEPAGRDLNLHKLILSRKRQSPIKDLGLKNPRNCKESQASDARFGSVDSNKSKHLSPGKRHFRSISPKNKMPASSNQEVCGERKTLEALLTRISHKRPTGMLGSNAQSELNDSTEGRYTMLPQKSKEALNPDPGLQAKQKKEAPPAKDRAFPGEGSDPRACSPHRNSVSNIFASKASSNQTPNCVPHPATGAALPSDLRKVDKKSVIQLCKSYTKITSTTTTSNTQKYFITSKPPRSHFDKKLDHVQLTAAGCILNRGDEKSSEEGSFEDGVQREAPKERGRPSEPPKEKASPEKGRLSHYRTDYLDKKGSLRGSTEKWLQTDLLKRRLAGPAPQTACPKPRLAKHDAEFADLPTPELSAISSVKRFSVHTDFFDPQFEELLAQRGKARARQRPLDLEKVRVG